MSFGWAALLEGTRFLAPVSEEALLEAAEAAGLGAGATVLELSCGNGAVSIFLAEALHLYARGVEGDADLLAQAVAAARRSPARRRLRFLHAPGPGRPRGARGPVDALVALRPPNPGLAATRLRGGGRVIAGRFLAPPELAGEFPAEEAPGRPLWRREATPLEWERFWAPQERSLRRYRATLRAGDPVAPLALAADRRIHAFRAHAVRVRYELVVAAP